MQFIRERTQDGVTERLFDLEVAGERVPGVVWAPENADGPRPLVLMGHGGSQHKKIGSLAARARRYAQRLGYATAAIDAPDHGDRVSRAEAMKLSRQIAARLQGGQASRDDLISTMGQRVRRAVPEWRATLDAVQALDFVGVGKVGYWGVSMGTAIGVPFVAAEPRITAAVFGLAGARPGDETLAAAAAAITVPVEFVFQWDDEIMPRDRGLALYDAFGSKEKAMHVNPGGHLATPNFEADSWERFFQRHLG